MESTQWPWIDAQVKAAIAAYERGDVVRGDGILEMVYKRYGKARDMRGMYVRVALSVFLMA